MKMIRLILVGTLLLLVAGCDSWLPEEGALRENFSSNRDAFEAIRSKIGDTDYIRVSLTMDPDNPNRSMTKTVLAEIPGDEFPEEIYIRDDPDWSRLFQGTGAVFVSQYEGVVELDSGFSQTRKEKSFQFRYIHDKAGITWRKTCLPEHEALRCGQCAVELEGNWLIDYYWSPTIDKLVPTESFEVLDESYDKAVNWELARCQIDGYTAIGYDEKILQKIRDRRDD